MEYGINKGIGKSVEFRGLKAQYLFIFAGGLLAVFVVFVILYMAGVDQWVCIAFGVAAASVLVWLTFRHSSELCHLDYRSINPDFILVSIFHLLIQSHIW